MSTISLFISLFVPSLKSNKVAGDKTSLVPIHPLYYSSASSHPSLIVLTEDKMGHGRIKPRKSLSSPPSITPCWSCLPQILLTSPNVFDLSSSSERRINPDKVSVSAGRGAQSLFMSCKEEEDQRDQNKTRHRDFINLNSCFLNFINYWIHGRSPPTDLTFGLSPVKSG